MVAPLVHRGKFLSSQTATKFSGNVILFAFIITCVKFQLKLMRAKNFLPMIAYNDLYCAIYSMAITKERIRAIILEMLRKK